MFFSKIYDNLPPFGLSLYFLFLFSWREREKEKKNNIVIQKLTDCGSFGSKVHRLQYIYIAFFLGNRNYDY